MRILILSAEYPPMISGMGDYGKNLVDFLKQEGHEISVLTSNEVPGWDSAAWPAVRSAVEKFRPEIFHIQYMTSTFQNKIFVHFLPFYLKRKFPQLRVVTTYHELAAPWKRLLLLPLFWGSDANLVTNERHFNLLNGLRKFFVLPGPLEKIHLGANVFPVSPDPARRKKLRSEMGVQENEFLFVRFGILHDVILPRLVELAGVFEKARAQGLPAKLLLMGKAEPRAKEGLLGKVAGREWIIFKSDLSPELLSEYLHASDAGLALYPDGVSEKRTAFLSLLAHGLPVIATQRGKLPAELKDGENILCVPVGCDENLWIQSVRKLIGDPRLRSRLSQEGRKVAALHDWKNIASETTRFYQKILK